MTSFLYTFDADAEEPIMLIDKHIGFDEADGFGIMGDQFQRELLALDAMDKKRIQVWINSPGGIVSDGYNIYNAILKTKTKVDTYCTGIAASIAAVIFQAGRTRYMADYGKLMYHNPYGSNDDKGLDAIRDSLVTMIVSRTGSTDDVVKKMMNKTTWMGADEARDCGFCDEIQASADHNKKRAINTPEEAKAMWKESNKVLNKILYKKNPMSKVANKLNLNADASEDSIVVEIEKFESRTKTAEEALNKKESEMKKKEEELDALNKKMVDLSNELDSMKAKAKEEEEARAKKEAEDKAKAEEEMDSKAKNMIADFVKAGRIKNDATVIEDWVSDCKVLGIDKVKARIEGLPVNATAAKINVSGVDVKKNLTNVVANKMAELLSKAK